MMPVDHIAFSIAQLNIFKKFHNFPALLICLLTGVLPDLPIIFSGGPGTIGYLSHRTLFHSLFFAPIFCTIPIIIFGIPFRKVLRNTFLQLYSLCFIVYLGHIFLDLLTPYGTQLFYPLTNRKFSMDLFHSFDPVFMAISLSLIIFSIYRLKFRKFLNAHVIMIFSIILSIYVLFTIINKKTIFQEYQVLMSESFPLSYHSATIPKTFWRWKCIASSNYKYIVITKESKELVFKIYPQILDLSNNIKKDKYFLEFMDYARYPTVIKEGREIHFTNLIYSPDSYRLSIKLNEHDEIVSHEISGFDLIDP